MFHFDTMGAEKVVADMKNQQKSANKYFSRSKVLYLLNTPICTGKTTAIVKIALRYPKKVVYLVPAYDELNRFLDEWKKRNPQKKLVVFKGKNQVCIRNNRPLHCNGCPYKRIVQINEKIYTPELYANQRVCPYFNLLRELHTADVILSHYLAIYELYKRAEMPYDPSNSLLILDEGDKAIRQLKPKPFLACILPEEPAYQWMNLEETKYYRMFSRIVNALSMSEISLLWDTYCKLLNPYNYVEEATSEARPLREVMLSKLNDIKCEILRKSFAINLDEVEYKLQTLRILLPDLEYWKQLFLDWLYACCFLFEIKANVSKENPDSVELYLVPFPVLFRTHFLAEHKEILLASASVSERDLRLLDLHLSRKIQVLENPSRFNHVNVLVLHGRYNPYSLAHETASRGLLTYVIHSSYREARTFARRMNRIDCVTPHTLEDLENAINEGICLINFVQTNPRLSLNNRLKGDVAIVGTYISKHVDMYSVPELLMETTVLSETYQALGRLINNDNRPVVLVMPEEVFKILEGKFRATNCTIQEIENDTDCLNKIINWIPNPIGLQHRNRFVFETTVKVTRNTGRNRSGQRYEYGEIRIKVPPRLIGKTVKVRIEE